jgi:hypothetical protein
MTKTETAAGLPPAHPEVPSFESSEHTELRSSEVRRSRTSEVADMRTLEAP